MADLPKCTKCGSAYTYDDGMMFVCPECGYEWSKEEPAEEQTNEDKITDAYGNLLSDGDTVTVIKNLKVKGSTSVIKVGTKIKNVRVFEGEHDLDCKIEGIGAMKIKPEFVKKA